MGTGSIDEAQAWVEYCNGTGNTHWANLRRKHGHEAPFNVRYWGLGNELYGGWQLGASTADDYVKKAREFSKVMKLTIFDRADLLRSERLERLGSGGDRGLAQIVDYHSIHIYTGSSTTTATSSQRISRARDPHLRRLHRETRYNQRIDHPIGIATTSERLVPNPRPSSERAVLRAVRPFGRAGHRHLPEHLHSPSASTSRSPIWPKW